MALFRRILVGDQERVLLIFNGRFEGILDPGAYVIRTVGRKIDTERHKVAELVFTSGWAEYLYKERPRIAERYFTTIETNDSQVAMVYLDGKLSRVLLPGKRVMYWRGPVEVTSEIVDVIEKPEVPDPLIPALSRLGRETPVSYTTVDEGKSGVLFVDGRFVRTLTPGTYAFWTAARAPRIELVELRLQTLEIPGQEILAGTRYRCVSTCGPSFRSRTPWPRSRRSATTASTCTALCSLRCARRWVAVRWRISSRRRSPSKSRWPPPFATRWLRSAFAWAPSP